jgi:hypothetical protein
LLQLAAGAETPSNVMDPEGPKAVPVMVTVAPTWAAAGDIVVMAGAMVQSTVFVVMPPVVTETGTVPADNDEGT